MVDNTDVWEFTNSAAAYECAKFGTGSNGGSAEATINLIAGEYTINFKAGAWDKSNEKTTLSLSATGADIDESSVTLVKGEFNDYSATLTVEDAGEVSFSFYTSSGGSRFFLDEVQLLAVNVTPTVSAAGWATYVTPFDVEFAENTAFVVTSAGDKINAVSVTQVPAGTPLLLKGEGTKTATVLATAPAAPTTNLLAISNGTQGDGDYVLYKDATHDVGFYKWSGTLDEGKVYLPADAVGEARSFIGFDDATTGINALDNLTNSQLDNAPMYNLAGQRVNKNYKGVVIVNGKKMLNK